MLRYYFILAGKCSSVLSSLICVIVSCFAFGHIYSRGSRFPLWIITFVIVFAVILTLVLRFLLNRLMPDVGCHLLRCSYLLVCGRRLFVFHAGKSAKEATGVVGSNEIWDVVQVLIWFRTRIGQVVLLLGAGRCDGFVFEDDVFVCDGRQRRDAFVVAHDADLQSRLIFVARRRYLKCWWDFLHGKVLCSCFLQLLLK